MTPSDRSVARGCSRRAVLAGISVACTGALAGCAAIGGDDDDAAVDWTMFRADAANTGHTNSSGPVDALEEDWHWSFDLDDEADDVSIAYSSPVLVGDTVLAACHVVTGSGTDYRLHRFLVAIDLETGDERWRSEGVETDFRGVTPPRPPMPLVVDETVHVVDSWGRGSFDLEGNELAREEGWEGLIPIARASPTGTDERLYVPGTLGESSGEDEDGEREIDWSQGLLALDPDGGVEWEFDAAVPSAVTISTFSPAADDETVYCSVLSDLYAVDATNGSKRWQWRLEGDSDADEGEESEYRSAHHLHPPVVGDDHVYVSSGDPNELRGGTLSALAPADGEERWRFSPEGENSGVFGSPVWDGDTLYICGYADERTVLVALDSNGESRWTVDVPAIDPSPVVADGVVYVRNTGPGSSIEAYDSEDGTNLADGELGWEPLEPAIGGGRYCYGYAEGIVAISE